MSSRIAVIAINAVDPRVVADFWCAVLGWRVVEEDDDGVSIAASDGSWPSFDVVPVPEVKAVKNRLHRDLRADGATWPANSSDFWLLVRDGSTWARTRRQLGCAERPRGKRVPSALPLCAGSSTTRTRRSCRSPSPTSRCRSTSTSAELRPHQRTRDTPDPPPILGRFTP